MINTKTSFQTIKKEFLKRGVKVVFTRSRDYILQPNRELIAAKSVEGGGARTTPFMRISSKAQLVDDIDSLAKEVIEYFPKEWYKETE